MKTTISVEQVTLYDIEQRFGLQATQDPTFFSEWQSNLPALSDGEFQQLTRIAAGYFNLERRALLEETVKLAVVAPLLNLAGFFLCPFYLETEKSLTITAQDEEIILKGRLDILVLQDQLWVLVIESKRAEFSLKVGIPQALTYMLAAPQTQRTLYAMVTNGGSFVFLKLVRGETPTYGKSKEFILGQDQGLAQTLQIMKRLATVIQSHHSN